MLSAAFDHVVLALRRSMLAREDPRIPILILVSVTVRHERDISHVEQVRVCVRVSERASNCVTAVGALGLVVELDTDFVLSESLGSDQNSNRDILHY